MPRLLIHLQELLEQLHHPPDTPAEQLYLFLRQHRRRLNHHRPITHPNQLRQLLALANKHHDPVVVAKSQQPPADIIRKIKALRKKSTPSTHTKHPHQPNPHLGPSIPKTKTEVDIQKHLPNDFKRGGITQ